MPVIIRTNLKLILNLSLILSLNLTLNINLNLNLNLNLTLISVEHKSYTFLEIKQKMVNYCVYQDRCHQEVEQKMRDFLLIPEAKEEILLYLMRENFLNEERFTRSYIRGKFYMKSWGRNKILNHLKFKGVPEKLARNCFDEIDDADYEKNLRKLYEGHLAKQSGKDYQKKSKTVKYLLGRGFEYEEILRVME